MRRLTVALFLAVVMALLLAACGGDEGTNPGSLDQQTNSEGAVSISVKPTDVSAEATSWSFSVALNTHMGDLGEDLTQSSVLVADGKEYQPVGYDGDPPGGHHRMGTIRFNPVTPRPGSIQIKIRQVGSVAERTFSWTLNP